MSVIERLKQAKESGRLAEIAQRSGVHLSTLYRFINGEREPQMSTLRRLLVAHPELDPGLAALLCSDEEPQ